MNSVILCEGSTDYVLLQYYMRVANGWHDNRDKQQNIFKFNGQDSRKFFQQDSSLTISAVGGSSRLMDGLRSVLQRNNLASPVSEEDFFDKIVIMTDRDEVDTEPEVLREIDTVLTENDVSHSSALVHNTWIECSMGSRIGIARRLEILLLVIPFEDNGALETFLLNAIAENDVYDSNIIDKCNRLVDNVDPEKRYLSKRRIITKAKFDTYFSIRTPAAQFMERQNI